MEADAGQEREGAFENRQKSQSEGQHETAQEASERRKCRRNDVPATEGGRRSFAHDSREEAHAHERAVALDGDLPEFWAALDGRAATGDAARSFASSEQDKNYGNGGRRRRARRVGGLDTCATASSIIALDSNGGLHAEDRVRLQISIHLSGCDRSGVRYLGMRFPSGAAKASVAP